MFFHGQRLRTFFLWWALKFKILSRNHYKFAVCLKVGIIRDGLFFLWTLSILLMRKLQRITHKLYIFKALKLWALLSLSDSPEFIHR